MIIVTDLLQCISELIDFALDDSAAPFSHVVWFSGFITQALFLFNLSLGFLIKENKNVFKIERSIIMAIKSIAAVAIYYKTGYIVGSFW